MVLTGGHLCQVGGEPRCSPPQLDGVFTDRARPVWGNPSQNIEKALHYHYQFRAATVLFLVVAISERPQQSLCSAGCHGSNKKLNCTFCFQYSSNSVSDRVQFIGARPHCSCAGRTHLSVRHWNERLYSFEEKLGREISFPQCYLLETIGVTPREIKF